jgi:F-type H+-transporting ATPase subunit delta
MKSTKSAPRYAKALIDLSIEQGVLEKVYSDILYVNKVLQENAELVAIMRSPIVAFGKKNSILVAVFGKSVSTLSLLFLSLLAKKGRVNSLKEITASFILQYKVFKNITTVEVTSCIALSTEQKNKVLDAVKSTASGELELVEKINPSLIGGYIVKVGDMQIDSSISARIQKLKKELLDNPYLVKL